MARKLNIVFLVVIAVTALLQSSVSQTTFQVGDALGWTIPSSVSTYSTWAANKNFIKGDILVFNFTTSQHTVAKVSKADYDACNPNNPISIQTNGPATVTLNETGAQYYICTVSTHCSFGQKLAINVSAATSSAPPPSTSPAATPTPPPSTTATPPSSATPPASTTAPPPPSTTATPPSTTTNPSVPSPTSDVTPPPPPSSATSLRVTGLCATFLSVVLVFLN